MALPKLTRRRFAGLTGSVALAGLAGCAASSADDAPADTEGSPTPTTTPTETPVDESTPENTEEGSVVKMRTDNEGSYFHPKGLLIEPGATVRFVNESGSHGTTAYHPDNEDQPLRIPSEAEPWDSPIYSEVDRSFEVTFGVEGVYDYYCPPHESMGMVGRIIVGEPDDGPGTTEPEELPPGAREALPAISEIMAEGTVAGP